MNATLPCFAMGLAEEDSCQSGFFIIRPEIPIPHEVTQRGMGFGPVEKKEFNNEC
jgi:hypothetical protein